MHRLTVLATCSITFCTLLAGADSDSLVGKSGVITKGDIQVTAFLEFLSQYRGAPVIYGSSTTTFDLNVATAAVGAPELGMISAGVAALAKDYRLPSFVAGG